MRYIYEGECSTDDFISTTEAVRLYDLKSMVDGHDTVQMIPMTNLKMNIYTFFEYTEDNKHHAPSPFENTIINTE